MNLIGRFPGKIHTNPRDGLKCTIPALRKVTVVSFQTKQYVYSMIRPKKRNTLVSANMTKKNRVGRSENLFIFCPVFFFFFFLLEKDQKCLLGLNIINSTENIHIMKFRTSRKLKNMIRSINFAILTFFMFFVQFSETF